MEHIVKDTEHAKDTAGGRDGEHSKQVVASQVFFPKEWEGSLRRMKD